MIRKVIAAALAAGTVFALAASAPATAAAAVPAGCVRSAGYICTPSGEKVKILPALKNAARGSAGEKVAKRLPPEPRPPSAKGMQAPCPHPDVCYLYNGGRQLNLDATHDVAGSAVNVKIGGQTGAAGTSSAKNRGSDGYHTLMETAVQGIDNGDTVEVGAIQGLGVNGGAEQARPFVFHWINGKGQGYNGFGFVPVSGAAYVPGVTNLTANTCYETEIWHDTAQAVWWTAFNACGQAKVWMGFIPDNRWTDPSTGWAEGTPATPADPFVKARHVQIYAEVAATVTNPCTDHGNGLIASNVNAASFTNIRLLNQLNRTTIPNLTNMQTYRAPTTTTGGTFSNTYSLGPAGAQTGFRVGGPNFDKATGTVTGIVGC